MHEYILFLHKPFYIIDHLILFFFFVYFKVIALFVFGFHHYIQLYTGCIRKLKHRYRVIISVIAYHILAYSEERLKRGSTGTTMVRQYQYFRARKKGVCGVTLTLMIVYSTVLIIVCGL